MSDESTSETGKELVRGERGRFAAGGPSANPKGRPKRGHSLAEQWRREVDWEKVRARLERVVTSDKSKDSDAISAAGALLDRAWGKPLSSHELHVTGTSTEAPERDWSAMPIEERRALLEKLRSVPQIGEGHQTTDPVFSDENEH